MSIIAKQRLTREIQQQLRDKLTATGLDAVIEVLTTQLVHYELERLADDQGQDDFNEILGAFLDAKNIEGLSPGTIEGYRYRLSSFRAYDKTPLREMTVYNIRQYLAHEKERGIKDKTLEGNRAVLNGFFGWAQREGLIPKNPCANLGAIKCKKEIRLPYSDVELEKLKEACTTPRDKALIAFLHATGCRVSEVCALDRADVDLVNQECLVLGKGNKERTVYLNDVCAMRLQIYLDSRKDNGDALFAGRGTKRMTPQGVRQRLKDIGQEAGVENVHPHRFRRTLATNLIDHGMAIQEVASVLGHERIDTTTKYIYIDKQNVKNAYKKYS